MPPTMLLNSLEHVRRRVRLLGIAYGVGIVLAGAVGLLLAIVLIDYVVHLPAAPRLIFLLGAVAAVVYGAYRWVITPSLARLSLSDVAGRLEQAFPQFNDRLRSTVDFVRGEVPGSEMMKQRVVGETTELAGRLDLGSAVVATPAWYSLGAGLGAVLLLAMLAMLSPRYTSIAMSRLFSPFHAMDWPKRVQIELSRELPSRVPVGQRIDVQMKLSRGDSSSRKAYISYQYDDGPIQRELMIRGADGTYAASLDARVESGKAAATLKILMESGDDQKQLLPITVVPRMAIKSVEASITPPPYVKNRGPATINLATAPALAADGSQIALKVSFTKPLAGNVPIEMTAASAEMKLPADIQWKQDGPNNMVGSWLAHDSLRFHVRATDVDGFHNNALEEYELIVRPDQSPSVQIEEPRRNEERTAKSTVPLVGLADDDYGIQSLKLVVERPADQKHWETPLIAEGAAASGAAVGNAEGAADRVRLRVNYQWELSQLKDANIKAGDILEYFLLAKDNFDLNGQQHPEVPSGRLRITIISEDELSSRIIDELRQIKTQIQGVKATVDRTRQETMGLADDTRNRALDEADRAALDRLTNQQATSTSQTKQIAERVDAMRQRLAENHVQSQDLSELARNVTADLERAAENPMREATNQLSVAGRQGSDPQRNASPQNSAQPRQPTTGPAGQNPTGQQPTPQNSQQANANQGQPQQGQPQQGQAQQGQPQQGQPQQGQPQQTQPQQPNTQQRNDALAQATENQQKASEELQRALDRMNNIGSLQETMARLRQLLDQQQQVGRETRDIGKENLGKTPEQMKPQDRDRLNNNADEQAKLAEQTNKAMEEMQRQSQQMQKSDPSTSAAMQRAAQTGRQQQTSQNQQRASEQTRQNQQAQAQAAQRQAELGLELMLNDLREAERHKLAELQKKLEELQNQVINLIRRQAGHNLDNLAAQGDARVSQLPKDVLAGLIEKAQRDPEHLPPVVPAIQLSPPQEQTERNTRDISKSAEEMPNGAEAASRLTRAASKMERAIVNLREQKLPDAYDPSQVEALAELDAASKNIAQQQQQVNQQVQDQQKEAIRQRFVKIRDEQQKLNEETTRIDKARNPADQTLGRADAVRLGQMPGEQGKLADTTNQISEDLAGLGSTVYTWANKDIVESMNDVKDDLGKRSTGAGTQSEQARILDQLDAMIRNLAVKPRQSQFAQDQGGGGGGGGGAGAPRLPTEAELRLLQDLQRAVNKSTETLDKQGDKEKPKLLALGTRQGELRGLLDQMLQKASRGKIKLGPEPDNRDQLPEEAKAEDIDNQELEQNLLKGVPDDKKADKEASLIGDRMARSRQRLALNNDPGKVTQEIQKRIVTDLDPLIEQARQQQAQVRNPAEQQRQQMAQARAAGQQPQNQQPGQPQPNAGQTAAAQSTSPGPAPVGQDLSKEIKDSREDWGAVAPRLRDAVTEGAGENIPGDYRKLVEEYYRSVSSQGTGQ